MTYFFETYGCQMNTAESAAVERLLAARHWTDAGEAETADMVIINTCSVRQTAENRVFGRLGYYAAMKRERAYTLVVMGCMAERLKESLKKDYHVDYAVGNFEKQNFPAIIDAVMNKREAEELTESAQYEFAPLSLPPKGAASSYVPIMHGCNNFCTYCIVPYVRGREVSRPAKAILDEVDVLSQAGIKEITLLGQNVNSYCGEGAGGRDGGEKVNFAALLRLISHRIEETHSSIRWVRFISSHPKDLTDEVIAAIAECPSVCRHIHLPVQSGSDAVLLAMRRCYTRADYLALVRRIRKALPDVSLTTDIMVGFPGETEADFAQVLSLMDEVRYENAFMYYYNEREGTEAAKMPGRLDEKVKKQRLQQVIDKQLLITKEVMESRVGSAETALVEGVSRDDDGELLARTQRDERVVFKGDAQDRREGSFVRVKLNALSGHTYKGQLL